MEDSPSNPVDKAIPKGYVCFFIPKNNGVDRIWWYCIYP